MQVFCHYLDLEETKTEMWRKPVSARVGSQLALAVEFTGDAQAYGQAMMDVVKNWPNSCNHNLSNLNQNRRAWVGHAACAFRHNLPESIVRSAWNMLDTEQRRLANLQADNAIQEWEKCQKSASERTSTKQLKLEFQKPLTILKKYA